MRSPLLVTTDETVQRPMLNNRITLVLTLLTTIALGQKSTTNDVLEIIKIGLQDHKLPRELINNVDSTYSASLTTRPRPKVELGYPLTVGVEGTPDNGLTHRYHIKWDDKKICVWGEEMFFVTGIYWISPSNVTINGTKLSFDFATHTSGIRT